MTDQPSLFEADAKVPRARVDFLTGMLAQWTFGDVKIKKHERERLEEIADVAIGRANQVRVATRGDA